jgi:hypothetical protein
MNSFKTAILMTVMMVLFILVGNLIGGQSGMTIAFIISLALISDHIGSRIKLYKKCIAPKK